MPNTPKAKGIDVVLPCLPNAYQFAIPFISFCSYLYISIGYTMRLATAKHFIDAKAKRLPIQNDHTAFLPIGKTIDSLCLRDA